MFFLKKPSLVYKKLYWNSILCDFLVDSRLGSGGGSGTTVIGPVSTNPPPVGLTRTVVLLYKQTTVGQDVFLRGGIDHDVRPG